MRTVWKPFGLLLILGVTSVISELLTESGGFHCKTKFGMRLDRRIHGFPRQTPPPFELLVLDEEGHQTEFYQVGKIYTIRLIGYTHYRGLILQPRLCDEYGFVVGSLTGGRFLETPSWIEYGLRLQECDSRYPQEDSVTHSDDSRKFVSQLQWTTSRDIGNVQFMLTIASENDIYWERWRPRGGFLQPLINKEQPTKVLKQVFHNEKYALKFLAGKLTSLEGAVDSQEALRGEAAGGTEKMIPETMQALENMEMPEFWASHDGEVKVHENEGKIDVVVEKDLLVEDPKKAVGDSEKLRQIDSGEAVLDTKTADGTGFEKVDDALEEDAVESISSEITARTTVEVENILESTTPLTTKETESTVTETLETTTAFVRTEIPAHESVTFSSSTAENLIESAPVVESVDSGEATVVPTTIQTSAGKKIPDQESITESTTVSVDGSSTAASTDSGEATVTTLAQPSEATHEIPAHESITLPALSVAEAFEKSILESTNSGEATTETTSTTLTSELESTTTTEAITAASADTEDSTVAKSTDVAPDMAESSTIAADSQNLEETATSSPAPAEIEPTTLVSILDLADPSVEDSTTTSENVTELLETTTVAFIESTVDAAVTTTAHESTTAEITVEDTTTLETTIGESVDPKNPIETTTPQVTTEETVVEETTTALPSDVVVEDTLASENPELATTTLAIKTEETLVSEETTTVQTSDAVVEDTVAPQTLEIETTPTPLEETISTDNTQSSGGAEATTTETSAVETAEESTTTTPSMSENETIEKAVEPAEDETGKVENAKSNETLAEKEPETTSTVPTPAESETEDEPEETMTEDMLPKYDSDELEAEFAEIAEIEAESLTEKTADEEAADKSAETTKTEQIESIRVEPINNEFESMNHPKAAVLRMK